MMKRKSFNYPGPKLNTSISEDVKHNYLADSRKIDSQKPETKCNSTSIQCQGVPANAHAFKEVPYYTQNLLTLFLYFLVLVSVHFTLSKGRIDDKNKTCKKKMESELQIRLIPFFFIWVGVSTEKALLFDLRTIEGHSSWPQKVGAETTLIPKSKGAHWSLQIKSTNPIQRERERNELNNLSCWN